MTDRSTMRAEEPRDLEEELESAERRSEAEGAIVAAEDSESKTKVRQFDPVTGQEASHYSDTDTSGDLLDTAVADTVPVDPDSAAFGELEEEMAEKVVVRKKQLRESGSKRQLEREQELQAAAVREAAENDILSGADVDPGVPDDADVTAILDYAASGTDDGAAEEKSPGSADDLQATIDDLSEELVALRRVSDNYREAALQVRAEAESEKQRQQRDMEKARSFALEKSLRELLPVIDSLEFGLQAADGGSDVDVTALREGLVLTLEQFGKFLNNSGVEAINPVGAKFNPELHEAVSAQAVVGASKDHVVTVVQKGYMLNGRLLRPAKVIVSS